MPQIHPTAVVSPECELADDAQVGPYCFLSGRVKLGPRVRLMGNNYINGPVSIGAGTVVYPFACLGYEPQDYKFKPGMQTAGVEIGEDCIFREHVTVHAASNDHTPTRLGNRVFMMVNSHVAHDCTIGNNVVFVNGAGIAGHGVIDDNVTLGGNAVIHQFVRIGRLVMMSGDCAVSLDVPPFCTVSERNRIGSLNLVGLRRAGVPREHITELRRAFREVLRHSMPRNELIAELTRRGATCPPLAEMAEFVAASKRGITPGLGRKPRDASRWLQDLSGGAALAALEEAEAETL
jgi:UDP-N-acetylglucosamine acyltransferase